MRIGISKSKIKKASRSPPSSSAGAAKDEIADVVLLAISVTGDPGRIKVICGSATTQEQLYQKL